MPWTFRAQTLLTFLRPRPSRLGEAVPHDAYELVHGNDDEQDLVPTLFRMVVPALIDDLLYLMLCNN